MRSKVNPSVTSDIAERFIELIERHLQISWAEVVQELGYSNRTTVDAIRKSRALPGPDKIYTLARFRTKDGQRPNIDWLFSGEGHPLLAQQEANFNKGFSSPHASIAERLEKLPRAHSRAVLEIIKLLSEHSSPAQ